MILVKSETHPSTHPSFPLLTDILIGVRRQHSGNQVLRRRRAQLCLHGLTMWESQKASQWRDVFVHHPARWTVPFPDIARRI